MPQIEVKTKQGQRRFELTDKPISVGRADNNTLVIKDSQASRHHCVIEPTSDGFRIRDLDSRNGTTLNKNAVTEDPLANGDVIQIGRTRITFINPEEALALADMEPSGPASDDLFPPDLDTLDIDLQSEVAKVSQTDWEKRLEDIIQTGEERGFE